MEKDYSHTITYDKMGFTIFKPVRDETHFVAWDTIETILYGDSRIYHDHEEFIIYLSSPAVITLKKDAWWLNKKFFWMTPKKSKKMRLRTDFVKGFNSFNEKLRDIYVNFKQEEYVKIFKSKNTEIYKTLYLNHLEIEEQNNSIFHPKFKDLVSLPNDLYRITLSASGKLASVTLPYKLPGFTYEPKIKDEDSLGISVIVFFHRKKAGEPLEIIR